MFDLLDRLDKMGPRGAPIAVVIGLLLACLSTAAIGYTLAPEADLGPFSGFTLRVVGGFGMALAVLFLLMAARHRAGPRYPDPADVFPALAPEDFRAAMYAEPRPLCACSACRIHLPAHFSTGACPCCSSSVNWHHVDTDDDADLVCSAVH